MLKKFFLLRSKVIKCLKFNKQIKYSPTNKEKRQGRKLNSHL